MTYGEDAVVYMLANHLFTTFCTTPEALDRTLQTVAQTWLPLHTGAVPLPTAFMRPLRHVLKEACAPSCPWQDDVAVEHVLVAISIALTAIGPQAPTRLAARNHWRYVRKVRDYIGDRPGEAPGLTTSAGSLARGRERSKQLFTRSQG